VDLDSVGVQVEVGLGVSSGTLWARMTIQVVAMTATKASTETTLMCWEVILRTRAGRDSFA